LIAGSKVTKEILSRGSGQQGEILVVLVGGGVWGCLTEEGGKEDGRKSNQIWKKFIP
jgi:hypothetical protein